MLKNATDLENLSAQFLSEFNTFCKNNSLVGKVQADHIGLKCSSKEIYESQRRVFEYDSRFIYQSIISERRISIIGLKKELDTIVGPLNYLELSDQKLDNSQIDQIDHLEIVPTTISYEELVTSLKSNGIKMKEIVRPHHTTYDIVLSSGFIIKLSREVLVQKIKREEMV